MRKLFAFSLAVVSVATAIAVVMPGQMRNTITLTWDTYPSNAADVLKVYSSTNLSFSLSNWPLIATVSTTNVSLTISNIVSQQCWFYMTASNWWGESPPSSVVGTQQTPGSVSNLRISQ